MEQTKELLQEILMPPAEFTPIPFWFFNDEPNEDKIRRQLADYVEKGVNGIVLHPRIGVPESLPYLSEAYFRVVRFIVRTAAEMGMKVVLYDEGMYPSGSAHGQVVAANPDFASKGIRLFETEEEIVPEGEIITRFPDGKYLVYCFTHGTIRGIHFGEDDGEAGAPASADILNPAAVEEFIRLTHERYYEELKEYFGSTIIAFFTDEPCALGRNAVGFREWVPGMEKELTQAGGKLSDLQALFTNQTNATTLLYHKAIKKHLREIFYARLSGWCEKHGIALMGHPEASDDVEEELYFHIPGQDLIMRRVAPETGGLTEFDSVQAKLTADIARHLGRRRNANECFGVCCRDKISWYFTGADMKWYIDWLGIRGVNLFVPHAFYYSVAGERKGERPPDVGPNNIWWEHYRKFADYMKRLSYLMTDSVNGARVAVLCDNNCVPYRELALLYENQIEFNYLPVALLEQSTITNGRLCIQGYEYKVVLNLLDEKWTQLLRSREENTTSLQQQVSLKLQITSSVIDILADASCATVKTDTIQPALRVSALTKRGTVMYLFSNEGEEEIKTRVSLPGKAEVVRVDLWEGCAFPQRTYPSAEGTALDLQLQPRETVLLLCLQTALPAEATKWLCKEQEEVFLGDWTAYLECKEKESNRESYVYRYEAREVSGAESFVVRGEEMVECYVNGELAGVSFWGPHKFAIGSLLRKGVNEISLLFTGNAANIYDGAQIPFGKADNG